MISELVKRDLFLKPRVNIGSTSGNERKMVKHALDEVGFINRL